MTTIEKIRQEIERRIKLYSVTNEKEQWIVNTYWSVLSYLDTIQVDEPEGLDEAAEEYAYKAKETEEKEIEAELPLGAIFFARDAFKAGAEWDRTQGVTFTSPIDYDNDGYFLDSFEQQSAAINRLGLKVMDKVIVQIRKKED